MKVGDLVRHKSDGAVGVIVDEPFTEVHISAMLPSEPYVPVLFEGNWETPLAAELEVINADR